MPRLTCITTTFNDGPALLTSVRSVLNQSFEDFQYIIVDDGSAAETREILDGLKDDRLLVIRQANDGLSGARNKALEQVRGDYVCFLDADDARPTWAFAAIADPTNGQMSPAIGQYLSMLATFLLLELNVHTRRLRTPIKLSHVSSRQHRYRGRFKGE